MIDRQWMIDKIYEVCWWEFCDVMCDWEKKRGKYPVMIWDVLDYLRTITERQISIQYKWKIYKWELDPNDFMLYLMRNRKYLRDPIERQPDHLIKDIYKISLLQ
jgi:hypothetical protein